MEREAIARAAKERRKIERDERIAKEKREAEARGSGHCVYTVDNPFVADPYMACRTNATEEACMMFEEEGDGMMDISDAKYGEGDCSREASVGSCERGGWEEVYYEGEGDPSAVEMGCGFAGDWLEPKN